MTNKLLMGLMLSAATTCMLTAASPEQHTAVSKGPGALNPASAGAVELTPLEQAQATLTKAQNEVDRLKKLPKNGGERIQYLPGAQSKLAAAKKAVADAAAPAGSQGAGAPQGTAGEGDKDGAADENATRTDGDEAQDGTARAAQPAREAAAVPSTAEEPLAQEAQEIAAAEAAAQKAAADAAQEAQENAEAPGSDAPSTDARSTAGDEDQRALATPGTHKVTELASRFGGVVSRGVSVQAPEAAAQDGDAPHGTADDGAQRAAADAKAAAQKAAEAAAKKAEEDRFVQETARLSVIVDRMVQDVQQSVAKDAATQAAARAAELVNAPAKAQKPGVTVKEWSAMTKAEKVAFKKSKR